MKGMRTREHFDINFGASAGILLMCLRYSGNSQMKFWAFWRGSHISLGWIHTKKSTLKT